MKKNNKGKGRQHINVLEKSTLDDISLVDALENRFLQLCELYLRMTQEPLIPPSSLDRDFYLWRVMAGRHRIRDYRHTSDELRSVQRVAQWCVDVKMKLTNNPKKTVEWAS